MKIIKYFSFMFLVLISNSAIAKLLNCGSQELDQVMVQADRDDNYSHANSLVIRLKNSSCNERQYIYLRSNHPAYSGMLAIALAAKSANKNLIVIVNTSKVLDSATEISILINE